MKTQRKAPSLRKASVAFNHAMLYVGDVERAARFYLDLLAFKLIEQEPCYARLKSPTGETTLSLHLLEKGQKLSNSRGVRLYFEVKPLEAFCRRLARAGVNFTEMPRVMPWGWKHAYLRDPDGHELSLYWAGAKRFRRSPSPQESTVREVNHVAIR